MKRVVTLASCILLCISILTGCAPSSSAQSVEIDTTKLDEAADKLTTAADGMQKSFETFEKLTTVIESFQKALDTQATVSYATLILTVRPSGQDFSDRTQVRNALEDGGEIVIKDFSEDGILKAFTDECFEYGANDDAGYAFNRGSVLNYISSNGWELVSVVNESDGTTEYFFSKLIAVQ